MKKITFLIISLLIFAFAGCTANREATVTNTNANSANTNKTAEAKTPEEKKSSDSAEMKSPTETMGIFFQALQKKDNETIKKCLSKSSIASLEESAKTENKTIDQLINEGEDMSKKKIPAVRNEKIEGDSATLEVEDEKTKKWDTVPFIKEDGKWKIAYDKMES